ncbi:MAG TPA: YozE family protein [Metabacillus sp.]|nr:YozE family protein [Metabacillus sp.]
MKSFYHYLMKYRHPKPKDELSKFANDAYVDHGFPRNTDNYDEISSYLEMNGHYLKSMTVFDDAWERFQNEILKRI